MDTDRLIVCKRFAGEQHDIRDFVTPDQVEIRGLYEHLRQDNPYDTVIMCWRYLNQYVEYPTNPLGQSVDKQRLTTFGGAHVYEQPPDYWQFPYETTARVRDAAKKGIKTHGDCADVSFVLASVLRNELGPNEVHACIGTYILNGRPCGHAWVKLRIDMNFYYADATHDFGKPLNFDLYEEYVLFNDVQCNVEKDVSKLLY